MKSYCDDDWVSGVQIFLFFSSLRILKLSHIISILSISWKWKDWWTSCNLHMKNETKVHLKTLRHWCQMDSITLSQEIQTSKKKAFLAEMIASINNDLWYSKHQNFLFGCAVEFANHVTISWYPTFVFVDKQTKSVF